MQEIKIPKDEMLKMIELQLKNEIKKATAMMPTNMEVKEVEWTIEGISVWIQE